MPGPILNSLSQASYGAETPGSLPSSPAPSENSSVSSEYFSETDSLSSMSEVHTKTPGENPILKASKKNKSRRKIILGILLAPLLLAKDLFLLAYEKLNRHLMPVLRVRFIAPISGAINTFTWAYSIVKFIKRPSKSKGFDAVGRTGYLGIAALNLAKVSDKFAPYISFVSQPVLAITSSILTGGIFIASLIRYRKKNVVYTEFQETKNKPKALSKFTKKYRYTLKNALRDVLISDTKLQEIKSLPSKMEQARAERALIKKACEAHPEIVTKLIDLELSRQKSQLLQDSAINFGYTTSAITTLVNPAIGLFILGGCFILMGVQYLNNQSWKAKIDGVKEEYQCKIAGKTNKVAVEAVEEGTKGKATGRLNGRGNAGNNTARGAEINVMAYLQGLPI